MVNHHTVSPIDRTVPQGSLGVIGEQQTPSSRRDDVPPAPDATIVLARPQGRRVGRSKTVPPIVRHEDFLRPFSCHFERLEWIC
ncbi:hypothetical protein DTO280E4_6104 [Paecilomyces variotii]|nr:hypothetical protein DTO280E4_6104 [Paecilomyces variotii]KAJ9375256.1 hypothetical protein DTO282E5_240 [Paecilomyces variotii]